MAAFDCETGNKRTKFGHSSARIVYYQNGAPSFPRSANVDWGISVEHMMPSTRITARMHEAFGEFEAELWISTKLLSLFAGYFRMRIGRARRSQRRLHENNKENVFKQRIQSIEMFGGAFTWLRFANDAQKQRLSQSGLAWNVTFAWSFHFNFNEGMCFSVYHLISQMPSRNSEGSRSVSPYFIQFFFLNYSLNRNIAWLSTGTHSIDDFAIHNGICVHVNGQHKLCVSRRNGDGQMVDHHWYSRFAADSSVIYADRCHRVCHTQLEGFTVDCVVTLVRTALVLVNIGPFFLCDTCK